MKLKEFEKIFNHKEMYYVYEHSIENEVFYVGKGKGKRVVDFEDRNYFWKKHVDKRLHLLSVKIVAIFERENDAFLFEENLIYNHLVSGKDLCNIQYNIKRIEKEKDCVKLKRFESREKTKMKLRSPDELKNVIEVFNYNQILFTIASEIEKGNKVLLITDKSNFFYDLLESTIEKSFNFSLQNYNKAIPSIELTDKINSIYKGEFPKNTDLLIIPSGYLDYVQNPIIEENLSTVIFNIGSKIKMSKAINLISENVQVFIKRKSKELENFSLKEIKIPKKYLNRPLIQSEKLKLAKELGLFSDSGYSGWSNLKKKLEKEDSGYIISEGFHTVNDKRCRTSTILSVEIEIEVILKRGNVSNEFLNKFSSELIIPKSFLNRLLTKKDKDILCNTLNIMRRNLPPVKWKQIKSMLNSSSSNYEVSDKLKNINKIRTRCSVITKKV